MTVVHLAVALAAALVVVLAAGRVLRRDEDPLPPSMPRRDPFGRWMDGLRSDLIEAGITDVTPGRALAMFALIGLLVGLVIGVLLGYMVLGVVLGLIVTFVTCRNLYVGRRAARRRLRTVELVATASRGIADSLDAGMVPLEALRGYANRAAPGSVSSRLLGEEDLIARMLLEAIERVERGMNIETSLRLAADELGERYFGSLVETYLQSASIDARQLASGLRRVAREVEAALQLRQKRLNAIGQAISNNKLTGAVIVGIILLLIVLIPTAGDFYRTTAGQVACVLMAGWWWIGSKLLVAGWEVDL